MRIRSALTRVATLGAAAVLAATALTACGDGGSTDEAANPYGLLQPGVLRAGTLTDAPPNVYLKDGKFTGFDNDLLTAVAAKVGLKVEFVGTDFSALLSQVNNHKFDVGSSSITITEARRKTVDFGNGYDFGYFGLDVPAGSSITGFDQLAGKRVVVVQGTVQDDYATKQNLNPVRVPDYNGAINQLKAGTADAWIAPAEIGDKSAADSNGKVEVAAKQLSPAPTAYAVAKGNDKLREALNKGLDEVIADGTWSRLQAQYYPGRPIPADFKPGSGTVTAPSPSAAS
ncbi:MULTISPECIES: ABC transporter substrate-binding protein [Micromonospora]|uniref:Amino acid ABC transporter substrate-binding protein n=1 Tax=Micromonospora solifontis TaxID=2487138 RepID=A0ABX9WAN4_9ACTN|nr:MULTISPECIES: ABC transporter substrate-binding protein [Micromonospora]NES16196.1 amino acid ABC transporter substrate-binding protein [Micromonospora sp. PPF5-17B]NES38937.1 amino acid ABC transporter substrate-binding protein [Micromonospora solifontis]NES57683.1 amino acid ABC transporter substrate-binding protein [Micromonospora sp. PPF5-6]RNL92308.1 amino acid ABC transporter substrate-binding protein [Micromonospora solifontis]